MQGKREKDKSTPLSTGLIIIPRPPDDAISSSPKIRNTAPDAGPFPCDTGISYRDILDNISEGAMLADAEWRILYVNGSAADMLNLSEQETLGLRIDDLICGAEQGLIPTVNDMLERNVRVCIRGFATSKNNSIFPADILVSRLPGNGLARYILEIKDTSKLSEVEHALKSVAEDVSRAKRMEAAATVAGQIAHDFDNLLTPLFAYPDLIRRDLPEKCRGRELLDIMEKTAHDMSQITQQLLVLSRRGGHPQAPFNINDLVNRVVALHRDDAEARNIEIQHDLDEHLMVIKGSPVQMLRVIENLFQNAMDSTEQSGKVKFSTKNVYIDRPFGKFGEIEVGEYVKLSISDTGCGIPDEIKERIFEPFFTTRKTAKKRGSGLGLSVVQGIVGDHGGLIDLDSAVGRGTTFNIYFHIFREAQPEGTDSAGERLDGTGRSVLIVDDDAQQREIIGTLFEAHGFKVSSLPSGESAVEFAGKHSQPDAGSAGGLPDLIVLDVVMDPGMDGKETCKRILEINPRQRILLVSGYSSPEDVGIRKLWQNVSYLGKPLTWAKISSAIHWAPEPRSTGNSEAGGPVPCAPNTILLVDDEEGIRRLFHMLLSSSLPMATIEMAADGAEGVEAFKKLHHAVVVLDLKMPIMDGERAFAAIQEYCREKNWQTPATVFCTGFAPPSVVKRIAGSAKEHCLLAKPVSGDDLIEAVKERMAMRQ